MQKVSSERRDIAYTEVIEGILRDEIPALRKKHLIGKRAGEAAVREVLGGMMKENVQEQFRSMDLGGARGGT